MSNYKTFVPRLRREGLDESTIEDLLVNNPRRALSFAPGKSPQKVVAR